MVVGRKEEEEVETCEGPNPCWTRPFPSAGAQLSRASPHFAIAAPPQAARW
jgi:hypothetical protein